MINADGSGLTQISRINGTSRFPRLSPDGTRIVYTAISPAGTDAQIHVMNADGSGDKILTGKGNLNTAACWSADGRYLFFQTSRFGASEIYRMDAEGRNQVNLTRNPSDNLMPNTVRKARTAGLDPGTDQGFSLKLNAFPVPAGESLTVWLHLSQPGNTVLSLIDRSGRILREIARMDLQEGEFTCEVDIQGLDAGVYGIRMSSGKNQEVRMFVKK